MAEMIPRGDSEDELPDVQCSECDAVFTVIWNRSPLITHGVEYCPFCGVEFNDT